MPPEMSLLPLRLKLRSRLTGARERIALRATLTAAHLLGLATGKHLRDLRASKDPLLALQSRLEQSQLDARLAWEIVEILATRFSKIPERRRPHYSPSIRFRILELKNLLGWSREISARVFLLSPNTLTNWERTADAEANTVGATVKPVPPITRFCDCVRSLLQLMMRLRVGGEDLVAATLARAGWRLAPRSVRRIARQPPLPPPPQMPRKPSRPVIARFAHHVWIMDVTEVQAFLGGTSRNHSALRVQGQYLRHGQAGTLLADAQGNGAAPALSSPDRPRPRGKDRARPAPLHLHPAPPGPKGRYSRRGPARSRARDAACRLSASRPSRRRSPGPAVRRRLPRSTAPRPPRPHRRLAELPGFQGPSEDPVCLSSPNEDASFLNPPRHLKLPRPLRSAELRFHASGSFPTPVAGLPWAQLASGLWRRYCFIHSGVGFAFLFSSGSSVPSKTHSLPSDAGTSSRSSATAEPEKVTPL
jgi:hypothetical protein